MGTKRTWQWKHLLIFLACATVCFLTGGGCICPSRSINGTEPTAAVEPPPPGSTLPAETIDTPPASRLSEETRTHLTAARLALAEGHYADAYIEIELASRHAPLSVFPEALFLSGLFYADPGNPTGDMTKAHETIQRMEREYPNSEWVGEGRVVTELVRRIEATETENRRLHQDIAELEKQIAAERSSVQSLKSVLKRMKEIDLGIPTE